VKALDLTGQMFGRLIVEQRDGKQNGHRIWRCRCTCTAATVVYIPVSHLRSGNTTSCGCVKREGARERARKHDGYGSPEYRAWIAMIQRCTNAKLAGFHNYGGRGIKVCANWQKSFAAFLVDVGQRPSEQHSLDRYPDNDGHYEPGNVRWATRKEQAHNSRKVRCVTVDGLTLPISEWARRVGLSMTTLHSRLTKLGWTPERAVATPSITVQRKQR